MRYTKANAFATFLVACLLSSLGLAPVRAAGSPSRVRSTDPIVTELLKEGRERSVTFKALLDAIDHSTGFVYVEFGYCAFGHLSGCLLPFIASSRGDRYLRVIVTGDRNASRHDQLLALIAHELRHALEVIEHTEVVDTATMDTMYRKTGIPITGGSRGYETSAARAAGTAVSSELALNPLPGRMRGAVLVDSMTRFEE